MHCIRSRRAFTLLVTGVLLVVFGFAACSDALITAPRVTRPRPDTAIPVADAAADPAPIIVAAGDVAMCNSLGDEATALLLDSLQFDAVLALGDLAYEDGTATQFQNCYDPTWGRHKAKTRPAPGNHEYHTANAAGYFSYFGAAANPDGGGQSYYSFNLGEWHILSLDSNIPVSPGSPQLTWIGQDLAANPKACSLAYWHHPVFSSGLHGNSSLMRDAWRVLDSAGVDVVLVGHDHTYERFAPQTSTGIASTIGIREFVVGTGGSKLRSFSTTRANSELRDNDTWGVLKLTLHPTSYEWQFVPVAGETFTDQGTADCVQVTPPEANQQPVATLTEPADGATFTAPAAITLSATASDADGNLNRVEFYRGSTFIGSDATAPYSITWTTAAAGSYTLTARAVDAAEAWASSTTVRVTVTPPSNSAPTVSLTSPLDDANFTAPATITLEASATDVDGNLSRVEFYEGTTLLGSDATAPYAFTWNNVAAGTYTLTARAIDAADAAASSAEAVVTVDAPSPSNLPPVANPGGPYSGTEGVTLTVSGETSADPENGALTYAWNFGDGTTASGPSPSKTYGDNGTFTVRLVVTDPVGASHTATTTATIANVAPTTLTFVSPPTAASGVSYTLSITEATDVAADQVGLEYRFECGGPGGFTPWGAASSVSCPALSGPLTSTVRGAVRDKDGGTRQQSRAIEILAPSTPNSAPTVSLSAPADNATFTAPAAITLEATASDVDANLSRVEFYEGTTLLGSATATPYSFSWTNVAAGSYVLTARAVDAADAATTSTQVRVTVNAPSPSNEPPVANPGGPYSGTEGLALTLNGGGSSDPENGTLTYAWNFGDGTTASGASPSKTYADNGTFTITLVVTDPGGASHTATTTATIANVAPTLTFVSPPTAASGASYTLSITDATDVAADQVGLEYRFECGGPGGYTPWSAASSVTCEGGTGPATRTARGAVRDKDGGTRQQSRTLEILAPSTPPPNQPPVANPSGPYSGMEGVAITLDGGASTDPENAALTYSWDFGDGTSGTGRSPSKAYGDNGSYTVTLVVSDPAGASHSATTTVSITNVAPTGTFMAPATVASGAAYTLAITNATDVTADQAGLQYQFDCGAGFTAWDAGSSVTCSGFVGPAARIVGGAVRDKDGGVRQYSQNLVILAPPNQPPVANAGGPYTGTEGVALTVNGGGSTDPENGALTYAWNFGDGTTGTGASPTKTYGDNGTYTITLVVSDPSGASHTATTTSTIGNVAPTATFVAPATAASGEAYTLAVTNAGDVAADLPALEYQFDCGAGFAAWGSVASTSCAGVAGPATRAVRGAVRDKDGGVREFSATVNVLAPPNNAPTVSLTAPAADATFTAPATITLEATASDVDGNLSRVEFYQGTTLLASDATAPFTFTWSSVPAGSYVLTARAIDAVDATTTSAEIRVTVSNQPPVANAGGPYSGTEGVAMTLNGAGSTDPNGDLLTYAWDFGDGTTATGASPAKTYGDNGTYTITLTVADPSGASHSTTTTATIANVAPTGTFVAPTTVASAAAYTLALTNASDVAADRPGLEYRFECGAGFTEWGPASSVTCSGFVGPATRTVRGAVRDKDGGIRQYSQTLDILAPPNSAPSVSLTTPLDGASLTAPATITLSAVAADVDGNLSRVEFYQGTTLLGSATTSPYSFTWTNVSAGSYTLTARAVDGADAATTSAGVRVTVNAAPPPNKPPVANPGGPYSGTEGVALTLDAAGSSDPENGQLTYAWNFGDGTTGTGRSPSKVYADNGTYTITLVVADPAGASHSVTTTATVSNVAPRATLTPPPVPVNEGSTFTLALDAAGDAAGDLPSLQFAFDCGGGSGFGPFGAASATSCATVSNGTRAVRAAVRDKDGATSEYSASVQVVNVAPSVTITSAPTTVRRWETYSVEFRFTDPGVQDGPWSYRIDWGDGESSGPTSLATQGGIVTASHRNRKTSGTTVIVTIRVTDKDGAIGQTITTMNSANEPPVANAGGPYTGTEGVALSLNGGGSTDPENATLTYAWDFGDGTTGTGASPSKAYADNGTYTITLVVSDPAGESHTATTTATIANVAPTGTFSAPTTVESGAAYTLAISGATDVTADRPGLQYQFDCGAGLGAWSTAFSTTCPAVAGPATRAVRGVVRDKDGGVREFSANVSVLAPPNSAPSVSVTGPSDGATFTAPATVTLSAIAADVDGNLSRVEFLSGTAVLGSDGTAPYTFTWSAVPAGSYTVTARAVDAAGAATSSAAVGVTVNAGPVANGGGPYTGAEGVALTLDGGGSSDPENGQLSYTWNFGDGTTGTGRSPSKVYADNGTYTIALVVADPLGASHSATTTATIANVAPTGTFSAPTTVASGASYTLAFTNATDVAVDRASLDYRFDCGGGFGAWGSESSASCAGGPGPATRAVRGALRDKDGGVREYTANVDILNMAPSVSLIGPLDGATFTAPATITLTATASDVDGNLSRVEFLSGTTVIGSVTTSPYTFTWSSVPAGSYTLSARAVDAVGATTTSTEARATVVNTPPVANAGGPYTGMEGVALTVDGGGSTDPNGDVLTYAWNFGDGTTASGRSPSKAYADNGTFTITLVVSDPSGASHSVTTTATIANVAPTMTLVAPATVKSGEQYTLAITGATDVAADQPGLEYRFDCGGGFGAWGSASSTSCPGSTGPATRTVGGAVRDKDGGTRQQSRDVEIVNSAPTVSLIAPLDGANLTAPATVVLEATAADIDGNLSRVEFYHGTTLLGTDAAAPYTFTWSAVPAGSYVFTARAVDAAGASTTSTQARVTVINTPPVSNPAGPYTGTEGVALTLDGGGSTDPNGDPLTYAWNFGDGTTAAGRSPSKVYADNGTYTITLVVADPAGASHSATTTATITNVAPTGTFSSPPIAASGTAYTLAVTNAADVPADQPGLEYRFDCGAGFTTWGSASVTSCPGVPGPATRAVRGAVRDKDGGVREFAANVEILNAAPSVSLMAPNDGASFTAPATITLQASAADVDGNLSRVEFYRGTTLLGTVATAPYSFTWTNVPAGTYTLTARAVDAADAATTSAAVRVTANAPPVANPGGPYSGMEGVSLTLNGTGSADPENAALTYAWNFGDGTTATGPSPSKTYADNGTFTITLVVSDPAGASHTATTTATVANATPTGTFASPARVDGGAAYTLAITGAADVAADQPGLQYRFDCGAGFGAWGSASSATCPAVAGPATRTVRGEVRDKDGGVRAFSANVEILNMAPSVSLTAPLDGASFTAPATITASVTASDVDGNLSRVEFYQGTTLLASDATAPYTFTWSNVPAGSYTLTARAVDAVDATTTSTEIRVTVSNQPPVANAGGPYSGAEGVAMTLNGAGSTDPNGDLLTYAWDFGDGTTGTGASPSKTYADNGTYTITLTVSDPLGASHSATTTATIANVAPTGTFSAPATVASGAAYTLAITGAADVAADQPGLEYQFDCGAGYTAWSTASSLSCAGVTGPVTRAVRGAVRDKDGGVQTFSANVNVLQPPAYFLVLDNGAIAVDGSPNRFTEADLNYNVRDEAMRKELPWFAANLGRSITLYSGSVGSEGWHALKTVPTSWNTAGPTTDGLRNYLLAGPGLGTPNQNQTLLESVPNVTPLRATGLKLLAGQWVCALVRSSNVSISYNPLRGNLEGNYLGIVAFVVDAVTARNSGSALPAVRLTVRDADAVCAGALQLHMTAPAPTSSSQPNDVNP